MSVICGYTPPGSTETDYMATVKGAPETLRSMVCNTLHIDTLMQRNYKNCHFFFASFALIYIIIIYFLFQFTKVPDFYDEVYLEMARRGARVLALGWKSLGQMSHQQLRETNRDSVESGLTFAGFVVISCPLKPDSKAVMRDIQHSSHYVSNTHILLLNTYLTSPVSSLNLLTMCVVGDHDHRR